MKNVENLNVEIKTDLGKIGKAIGDSIEDAVTKATEIVIKEATRPVQVFIPEQKIDKKVEGYSHEKLPLVLRTLSARLPLFLVGEAGSGKTHLVEQVAEVLGLNFYCISVCAQTTASSLLGYMNATGEYVRSLFREAYENGGVFLLDEVDNGNPNVLSVLNASISNHVCSFPDKMVKKHPDFVLCASGNTYGHGANRKYVGRLEIDGATLDRFVFIEIGYDEKLENKICGSKEYAKLVQTIRHKAEELKLRNIISPRASINGVKLLSAGMDLDDVLNATIFRDMSEDTIKKLTVDNKDFKKDYLKVKNAVKGKEEKPSKEAEEKVCNSDEEVIKQADELIKDLSEEWNNDKENKAPSTGGNNGGIDEMMF